MKLEISIRKAGPEDINTIGYLAHQIWPISFREILSPAQIDYMLNLIYNPQNLLRQMMAEKQVFLLAEMEGTAVEEEVRILGATRLRLNVNRFNKAVGFYENFGFRVIGQEDIDIGQGYFMNDYIMEKNI
jgi:diamine N-acetyltransferase